MKLRTATLRRASIAALAIFVFFSTQTLDTKPLRVIYVPAGALTAEDSAALKWLRSEKRFRVTVADANARVSKRDVVWIHLPDSISYSRFSGASEVMHRLRRWMQSGARFLFTNFAAFLPHDVGAESSRPEIRTLSIADDWLFDEKGFHSFRGHPLFDGLHGGAFVWDADSNHTAPTIGYFGDAFPSNGRVIGVEKSYITIHEKNKLIIEHATHSSRCVSVGGFIYFSRTNSYRFNTKILIRNAIEYVARDRQRARVSYWPRHIDPPKRTAGEREISFKRKTPHGIDTTSLVIRRDSAAANFFDLAGRRILVMGKERGGIDEVWVHPIRVIKNYEAGILDGDSVRWLSSVPARIVVRPESFTRLYTFPEGEIEERIVASIDKPALLVQYRASIPLKLVIRLQSDLRVMWPYNSDATGSLLHSLSSDGRRFEIQDVDGDYSVSFACDARPNDLLSGQYAGIDYRQRKFHGDTTKANLVSHAVLFDLASNSNELTVAIAGSQVSIKETRAAIRSMLANPREEIRRVVNHYARLLSSSVEIESPNREFNDLFRWAIVGTDRFVATTPGLGTGLLAGFSTTARGWDGGQKVSGRPGYAWYFGRDAAWSCFAIDAYGDFETVKRQIDFLEKYQDASGKIFHELTTSGAVHYDASDATPLYVILAAHYVRATGDVAFLRRHWDKLCRAMDYLFSTDTDGDGLIENTNVGHGWIEGGSLFGAHTEFYLAGLWQRALDDAAMMASILGDSRRAEKFSRDAAAVHSRLNGEFWNRDTRFFSLGKMKDGSFRADSTVLAAVPLAMNALDRDKAGAVLREFASNRFSSDWGMRIIGSSSIHFNPQGYHYGSVWPLFTGWTALAEYAYGRSAQAFMHVMNTMRIKNFWALGFVEEVMNGAVYKPSGVCPHQCWSETNIIHPVIEGMIGWKPNAVQRRASIAPQFPFDWDSVTSRNLRVGGTRMQMTMVRRATETTFIFRKQHGPPITLDFFPQIPLGMDVQSITLNSRAARFDSTFDGHLVRPSIAFRMGASDTVVMRHTGGLGVVAHIPTPMPGDSSLGFRVIDLTRDGNEYVLRFEGRAGRTKGFYLNVFDRQITAIDGGRVFAYGKNGLVRILVRFDQAAERFVEKTVRVRVSDGKGE